MITDEWVSVALTDDAAVVELLFRLKQASECFSSPPAKLPPLRWGHHQPRSKPATARKERDWASCSPTTPLSWSCGGGGGGASSTSDGADESNRPSDLSSGDRSKTFNELQQEESLLLKERLHLKKELASLRVTLDEQKARSENLKRLKLDLHLAHKIAATSEGVEAVNSVQTNLAEASTLIHLRVSPTTTVHDDHPAPASYKLEKQVEARERCFILPDLNMVPDEDDSACETLYGLS